MKLKWCSNCVSMSTRPRITFDKNGLCNACSWSKRKKNYPWRKNIIKLKKHLNSIKDKFYYDCIVPVSGGKDGSHVYHHLKKKFGLNPLAVSISPPLPEKLGDENLKNFIDSNVPTLVVNPPFEAMRKLNLFGFEHMGFPYYGWLISIHTAIIRIAINFNIKLIFYGEDGELEYGGTSETLNKIFYDVDYQKKIYLENGYDKILKKSKISEIDRYFFSYPKQNINDIKLTHYSYFENWDPYKNYLTAKNFYGLKENTDTNQGTFSNFAQNDQKLYSLHAYLMYLKFGFGRANQDSAIEVRRGAMSRDQAIQLIKLYDHVFPEKYLNDYLEYYQISKNKFNKILDKWANKKILYKSKGRWMPKFKIN